MHLTNIIQKIKLPFRKDKELYRCLYQIMGFYPKNISYYKQALLHKSMSGRSKEGRYQNNERLEFLGDAILDAVVGDIVYRHFDKQREGFLTNTRSKLVQRETLGKLAVEMGLDRLIQSNNHQQSHNSYMAGNAFEALVGAIYLDYGYARCMQFMEKRILSKIIDIDQVAFKEVNFKSKLLEWSQKNRIRMNFNTTEQKAENGAIPFSTQVIIEGLECGRGKGYSKKESEQNAAKETLYMLKKEKGLEDSVFEAKSRRTAMEEQPEALLPDIPEEMLEPAKTRKEKQPKKQEQPKKEQPKKEQPKKQEQPKKEQPKKQEEPKKEQPKKQEEPKKEQPKKQEQPKKERPKKEQPVKQEESKLTTEQPELVEETNTEEAPKKKPSRRRKPKAEKPATQEEAPVMMEDTPVVKEEAPVVKEEAPAQKEEMPVTKEEAPVMMEDTPAVNEEAPATDSSEPTKKPKRRRRKPTTHLKKEPTIDAGTSTNRTAEAASEE